MNMHRKAIAIVGSLLLAGGLVSMNAAHADDDDDGGYRGSVTYYVGGPVYRHHEREYRREHRAWHHRWNERHYWRHREYREYDRDDRYYAPRYYDRSGYRIHLDYYGW